MNYKIGLMGGEYLYKIKREKYTFVITNKQTELFVNKV